MEKTFSPKGDLTFVTVPANLKKLLKLIAHDKVTSLRFDLEQVNQCDSAGMALFIETRRLSRKYNKSVHIKGASAAIYALAKFCGVEELLNDQ